MGRISVPVQDLKDAVTELDNIADLIGNSATLHHAAGDQKDFKSFAGDSKLANALDGFDKAWVAGMERVHDNAKTFSKNVDTIADNFTETDEGTVKALDDDNQGA